MQEKRTGEDKVTHTTAVQVLQWSPDGRRLVAGDASGKLGVYKVDKRRPVPVVKYQVGVPPSLSISPRAPQGPAAGRWYRQRVGGL